MSRGSTRVLHGTDFSLNSEAIALGPGCDEELWQDAVKYRNERAQEENINRLVLETAHSVPEKAGAPRRVESDLSSDKELLPVIADFKTVRFEESLKRTKNLRPESQLTGEKLRSEVGTQR